jgi:hypothetical protein
MYSSLGTIDSLVKCHTEELLRQAEQARLANLAMGPGRPLRGQIAGWLVAIAERIEGTPRRTVASAG